MKVKIPIVIIIALIFSSCHRDLERMIVEQELKKAEEQNSSTFLFNATVEVSVSVEFYNPLQQPVSGVYTEIYYQNPWLTRENESIVVNENVHPVYKGMSNSKGYLETVLNIPTAIKKIYVRPFKPGFVEYKEIELNSEDISIVFGLEKVDSTSSYGNSRKSYNAYLTLGEWNNEGFPFYKEPVIDTLSNEFIDNVYATLPEYSPLPVKHPEFFAEGLKSDIVLQEDAELVMTFVHEGAAWENTLGYFHFPADNPPSSPEEVKNKTILFPNVSLAGSGGALQSGYKVRLKYYNEETDEFSYTFPAGTQVSWFLNTRGWSSGVVSGNYTLFSMSELNTFIEPALRKQSIVLRDNERDLFLIAFEDQRRDGHSDQDFNDAIFYVKSYPGTAIAENNYAPVQKPEDADGDGVNDLFDDFPENPELAYKNTYPSTDHYGTLAFEDMWPYRGDYDFNDLVVDYQFDHYTDKDSRIKEIRARLVTRAIGAGFHNALGFQLNALPGNVVSVSGYELYKDYIMLNSNGTEKDQSLATIIAYDNAWGLFGYPGVNNYINTTPGANWFGTDTLQLSIDLGNGYEINEVGTPPYNPFIIVNMDRGREVHLPGYKPTDLADQLLFMTGHDTSDPQKNQYYLSEGNLPWGLNMPVSIDYPNEKVSILNSYLHFEQWANTEGGTFTDWYLNKTGYRNESNLYKTGN